MNTDNKAKAGKRMRDLRKEIGREPDLHLTPADVGMSERTQHTPDIEEIIEHAVDILYEARCLSMKLDFTKAGVIINTAIQEAIAQTAAERDKLRARNAALDASLDRELAENSKLREQLIETDERRSTAEFCADKLREQVMELKSFAELVAENADHYADDYTEVESLRTELRGFAESARAAIAKAEQEAK